MSRCVCVRPPSNRPFLDVSSFIQPTVCISGLCVSRCVSVRPLSNRPFLGVSSFIQPTVCISGLCVCLDVSLFVHRQTVLSLMYLPSFNLLCVFLDGLCV